MRHPHSGSARSGRSRPGGVLERDAERRQPAPGAPRRPAGRISPALQMTPAEIEVLQLTPEGTRLLLDGSPRRRWWLARARSRGARRGLTVGRRRAGIRPCQLRGIQQFFRVRAAGRGHLGTIQLRCLLRRYPSDRPRAGRSVSVMPKRACPKPFTHGGSCASTQIGAIPA